MAEPLDDLITIARIARPQGIRGEVIADLLTDFPERFAKLTELRLGWPNGKAAIIGLERARPHLGRILLKLKGYDSRDAAETLRDVRVLVMREQLVALPADSYYDFDLVDCVVSTAAGLVIGKVVGVQNFGAAPLLVVRDDEQRERLIPLASSICTEVDVARKRIVIEPPEGLLDL
ncbi:MAG: 16S rRNA processing protein RimM [Acidobacteria bacterium]|nr:16S rRNA processing protein RimM [Acidobacteriota bacterium]MBI3422928.1 16S rRNA processing protein RimM [Acidobacteriota bacterium]